MQNGRMKINLSEYVSLKAANFSIPVIFRLKDIKLDIYGICDPNDPFKKVLMATIYNRI